MRKVVIAHVRCMKCNYEWHDGAGVFANIHECPRCASVYWKWLNYPVKKPNYCRICKKSFEIRAKK